MSVQPLTLAQIQLMKEDVDENGLNAAIQMYSHLNTMGYAYAGWAKGVATGTTITGQAALDYVQGNSLLAPLLHLVWPDDFGRLALSQTRIDNIRLGMATARVGCNNRRALHILIMAEYISPYAHC